MSKVGTLHIGAKNGAEEISIITDVNVTTAGIFSTTLKEQDVARLKSYGLRLNTNRLGREGYFESDTYDGLRKEIQTVLNEYVSREEIEAKEVIKYRINTNCHYVLGDKQDGFAIYPNGDWLPKRLQEASGCSRWKQGTQGVGLYCYPFSISLFVGVYKKITYRYRSGKTVTEYQGCGFTDGRSSIDYLKGTVKMGLNSSFETTADLRRQLTSLPEVDATEDNARVFVEILQFICRANEILKRLAGPGNIEKYLRENLQLKISDK